MTTGATYKIVSLADLFAVPADKRAECLRCIELTLAMMELEYGDEAHLMLMAVEWMDDGEMHVTDEATGLSLKVVKLSEVES